MILVDENKIRSWRQRTLTSSMALQTMVAKVDHIHPFVITTLCNAKVLVDGRESEIIRYSATMDKLEVPGAALVSNIIACHMNLKDLTEQYDGRSDGVAMALDCGDDMLPLREFAQKRRNARPSLED